MPCRQSKQPIVSRREKSKLKQGIHVVSDVRWVAVGAAYAPSVVDVAKVGGFAALHGATVGKFVAALARRDVAQTLESVPLALTAGHVWFVKEALSTLVGATAFKSYKNINKYEHS